MRKYILMFIICVSSFIIYTNNVKALTTTGILSNTTGNNYININAQKVGNYYGDNRPYFKGYGEGNVIFSILTSNQTDVVDQIVEVIVFNDNDIFACDIGNNTSYYDSQTERVLYTVNCPVNFPSGRGLKGIRIVRGDNYGILKVSFSQYITFISKGSVVDVSSIVNAINNQTNSLISNNNTNTTQIINSVNSVYSSISSILSSVNNIDTKLNDIKNNASTTASNTEEIKNDIKDSSIDNNNATGTINNLSGQLATDNTITSLLLLPINFINVLIDGLSGECAPYSLGELWGTEIVLPCVNLYNTFGAVWYMVDTGLSALVIFKMSKYFIRLFNKLTNLKDGGLEEAYS